MREETALRDAVAAVSRADTVAEVTREIAGSAGIATGGDSAFVERVEEDTGEAVVVAAAGVHAPPVGTRVRFGGACAPRSPRREHSAIPLDPGTLLATLAPTPAAPGARTKAHI